MLSPEVLHLAHPMRPDFPAMFASPDIKSDGKVDMILLSFRDDRYMTLFWQLFASICCVPSMFLEIAQTCTNICESNVLRLFSKRWQLCWAENSLLNGGASIIWLDIYENPTTIGCDLGQGDPTDPDEPWEVWGFGACACWLSAARCEECPWETRQNKCWGEALFMMDFGVKVSALPKKSSWNSFQQKNK